ncbi:MAG: FimV/HubP-related protein [Thiotrichales bacterium]
MDRLPPVVHISVKAGVRTVVSRLPVALIACLPAVALAISVGDIEIDSALNQPLSANIDINFSPGENVPDDALSVRIASPDQHHRNGLNYPAVLSGAIFSKRERPNGVTLHLWTNRPIQEPLLNFLLQIDWPAGRLLKEVPLFLDPPGYQVLPQSTDSQAARVEPVIPVMLDEPAESAYQISEVDAYTLNQSDLEPVETMPAAPARPARRSQPVAIKDGQYGPVRPGDSLSKIARAAAGRNASKDEIEARMRAIYFANPDAFLGSMDQLEAGSYLIIPDLDEVPSDVLQTFDHSNLAQRVAETSVPEAVPEQPKAAVEPEKTEAPAPVEQIAESKPAETQLNILPEDPAAQNIAKELSARLENTGSVVQSGQDKDAAPAADETSLKEGAAASAESDLLSTLNKEAEEALIADVQVLKAENAELKSQVAELTDELSTTKKEVQRLEFRVDELSNLQNQFGLDDQSLAARALRWAPWAALLLLLPLLLFALLRGQRKQQETIPLEQEYESGEKITPPRYQNDSAETGIEVEDLSAKDQDLESAAALDELSESTFTGHASETGSAMPGMSFDDGLLEEPEDVIDVEGLKPSTADTQENIRPTEAGAVNEDSTQILSNPEEPGASDSNLLQEAEVYLAYGQFALAEQTINKLLANEPDNDRVKLLQLKLFSEAGRMNELQSLSVDLLQKYPNPDNGMHQQVQNICERAFTRHASKEALTPPSTVEEERPDAAAFALPDTEPEAEPIDVTLDALTVDTLFKENIEDYLSGHSSLNLDDLDIDEGEPEERPATTSITKEEPADDLDLDQLTDEEMEALSQELDLPEDDDGLDELALEALDEEGNPNVEKFSDTDLRMPALKMDPDSPDLTGGLLDFELDLEAELEKAETKKSD